MDSKSPTKFNNILATQIGRGKDPTGHGYYGASRGNGTRKHEGFDIISTPGEKVYAPHRGVVRVGNVYSTTKLGKPTMKLIEVKGSVYKNKLMYVNPCVITGVKATKVVFTLGGIYNFTGCEILEVENISGSSVTITSDSSVATQTETSGTINLLDSFITFDSINSWTIYPTETDLKNNTTATESGTGVYRLNFTAPTTIYARVVKSGITFLVEIQVTQSGETIYSLSSEALLTTLPSAQEIWSYGSNSLRTDRTLNGNVVE